MLPLDSSIVVTVDPSPAEFHRRALINISRTADLDPKNHQPQETSIEHQVPEEKSKEQVSRRKEVVNADQVDREEQVSNNRIVNTEVLDGQVVCLVNLRNDLTSRMSYECFSLNSSQLQRTSTRRWQDCCQLT